MGWEVGVPAQLKRALKSQRVNVQYERCMSLVHSKSIRLGNRRAVSVMAVVALLVFGFILLRPGAAQAQEMVGVGGETQFVFNTFAFLIWGALVM